MYLCGAGIFGVLWFATDGDPIADGFRLIAVLLALVALVQIARGLLSD